MVGGGTWQAIPCSSRTQTSRIHSADSHVRSASGRRRSRHDRAVLNGGRRPGNITSQIGGSEGALPRWRYSHVIRYLCVAERRLRNVKLATPDHLAAGEGATRSGSYSASVVSIPEVVIAEVACVENRRIADERVANVDPFCEPWTATEPRIEWLTKPQREPANTEAEPTAEKTHECGAVDRRAKDRARAPAPPAAKESPAAIVKRSESPRLVAYPRPAPRTYIAPITVAVGSPIIGHVGRIPNWTVIRLLAPGSVVIKVSGTRHVLRNVF